MKMVITVRFIGASIAFPSIASSRYLYAHQRPPNLEIPAKKGSFRNSLESFDKRFRSKSYRGRYYRAATPTWREYEDFRDWKFEPRHGLFKLRFRSQVTRETTAYVQLLFADGRRRVSTRINCPNSRAREIARTRGKRARGKFQAVVLVSAVCV